MEEREDYDDLGRQERECEQKAKESQNAEHRTQDKAKASERKAQQKRKEKARKVAEKEKSHPRPPVKAEATEVEIKEVVEVQRLSAPQARC